MNIYNLSDHGGHNVLLTGDVDFVTEFARILKRSNIEFHIIAPSVDMEDIDVEFELLHDPEAHLANEAYAEFYDHLISDAAGLDVPFSHIVDLSIASNLDRKLAIELAATLNPQATIIVSALTNTATEFGSLTNTDERVVGIGLAPSVMSAVKTIDACKGLNTSDYHYARAQALLQDAGFSVETVEDRVGLVQMRVLAMLINEAAFAVMEGLASAEDIDKAMMLGVNYPKGLLAWADEIGIGVVTLILDGLQREYQQERYRPCVLLKQMMRAGWTGKSVGKGFFTYS